MSPRPLLFASVASLALACAGKPPTPTAPAPTASSETRTTAPTTVKRVVVSLGRVSGSSTITTAADGTMTTVLHVVENGRGPHIEATTKRAGDGTIARFTGKGQRTFGAAYEATFTRTGDRAVWTGNVEAGERKLDGPAFYLPNAEVPEAYGWLVQAAVEHGGEIALLPSGTARVEKVGEAQLSNKAGETRTVVAYMLNGLYFQPIPIWMNPDGSWFGYTTEWFSVLPEGWDSAVEPLLAKQRELESARDAKLAQELGHKPPAAGVAFTHARVLDVERGRWLADHTVVVVGDRIAAVGPSKATKPPAGAEIVDLAGKALLPGYVDMHAHLGDADGILDISAGVTTVRDVGNDPDKLDDFKTRWDQGAAIGPHVVRFGFIEGRNPKAASSKVTAETVDEAKAAVKFYADRKYEGIKIYNSMRTELVPVLTAEAHKAGLAVTGHIPVHMLANEAVRAGYDGIEHINMLFLNFFATHDTDTRDTTRFTLVGDKAPDFDLASAPVVEFIKLLVDRKTVIDPTLVAFEEILVSVPGKLLPGKEAETARLPLQLQRDALSGGLPTDEAKHARYAAAFDKMLAMTKALYDAKVRLVIGTDNTAGISFHHELGLYARAGIPNAAILRMATLDPARYLGVDKTVGSIARGKRADLVVVDGDPLANIGDAVKAVTTVRAGVVYATAPLLDAIGVAPVK